ncbi:CC_3452 family protein [Sphingopyxis sp. JAI128]|uniref:CC_3452 family protein n=1 Tax=Sphingopyxis sp. JAI128 TaxID=2723066 RepID=UPI00160BD3F7|nr:hypothetical protein [Sphingopyxis sp. JAI128]MBB6426174.1 hypothetical protein [Sphingopyxis sp. JAI128]
MAAIELSPRIRSLSFAGALTVGSLAFGVAAAAAPGGSYYRAELAGPAQDVRFVARDVVWACEGAECVARQGTSRPLVMCSSLAKAAGPVVSFAAGEKTLDADALARCNAAVK